jgi:uncharacterized GH25 family protein
MSVSTGAGGSAVFRPGREADRQAALATRQQLQLRMASDRRRIAFIRIMPLPPLHKEGLPNIRHDIHINRRQMKRRTRSALLLLALVCFAGVSAAHETWILPASMRVRVGQPITLSLTSGMAFPADDLAIQPARVVRAQARLGGRIEQLARPRVGPMSLRYLWTPRSSGVATIGVELGPRTLELEPNLIGEYFDEIHATDAVIAQWDSVPEPKRWRESYVKHASSFVRVGVPVRDASWASPLGLGLEIIPETDPTALVAGANFRVRVLRRGVPLPGFSIGVRREGEPTSNYVPTDKNGRTWIQLPRAGRWILFGTDLRRVHEPDLEWRSDFVTTTIGVLPVGTR